MLKDLTFRDFGRCGRSQTARRLIRNLSAEAGALSSFQHRNHAVATLASVLLLSVLAQSSPTAKLAGGS